MSEWTRSDRRVGFWSAIVVVVLGVAYIITGVVWLWAGETSADNPLQPAEPFLAILEVLILLSASTMVVLMAAVHSNAPRDRKTYSLASLAFTIIFATLTSSAHFVNLTVVRRMDAGAPGVSLIRLLVWPSASEAVNLLAWDLFLGLALLMAAPVFGGGKLQNAIRAGLFISGALCAAGILGPATGYMRLHFMATAGYAFGLPVVCLLLAVLFSRPGEYEG